MWPLTIIFPNGVKLTITSTHVFAACALAAATGLMVTYVHLLHESLAQGTRWRAEQLTSAVTPAAPNKERSNARR